MENMATGPIRLNFQSREQVLVIADNEDRFLIASRDAAMACKQVDNLKEFDKQFNDFLTFIHQWCDERSAKVRACFVTIGDSSLNVLVCLIGERYDFEFEDEIASLDLELADRFSLCTAEVLQIPNPESLRIEASDEAINVYGDGISSLSAGGA